MKLENFRMNDGSRQFATFAESEDWYVLRDHIVTLEGATLTGFITDDITEVWIDFEFAGYRFSVYNQLGEYWCFVNPPTCSDEILAEVVTHCGQLLQHVKGK